MRGGDGVNGGDGVSGCGGNGCDGGNGGILMKRLMMIPGARFQQWPDGEPISQEQTSSSIRHTKESTDDARCGTSRTPGQFQHRRVSANIQFQHR